MCGVIPSGPLAFVVIPLMIGGNALGKVNHKIRSINGKIRENNQRIGNQMHYRRSEWKEEWKERFLYRKQHKAEKVLVEKMKIVDQGNQFDCDDSQPNNQNIISSEDAILYVQRSVVRCASNKFEKALQDLRFSVYLDYTLKETYVVQYLEGFLLYMLGDYLESAHSFKKAIELKEIEDSKSIELEQKVFEIQNSMKHTADKMMENLNEIHEQTKSYFKSAHKKIKNKLLGIETLAEDLEPEEKKEVQHNAPMIIIEELYYRAGISYYLSAYYEDSIKFYSKAIKIGKTNLNHYYYNRGLSYFFAHEVDLALIDFLKAQSLVETDEVDKMIAYTYGRKGMKKEETLYLQKAKAINSNTKLVTCFIYRLLDDNCTELVFSFLPIHNRVLLSRTCKLWREIVMNSIAKEDVFKMSLSTIINNAEKHLSNVNTVTLTEKLFLPTHYNTHVMDLVEHALSSPVYNYYIERPAKKMIVYMVQPKSGFDSQYFTFGVGGVNFFKKVESLNIAQNSLRGEVLTTLLKESPELKDLTIRTGSYVYNDTEIIQAIPQFTQLKKLSWHFDFSSDTSSNVLPELSLPPSLEVFEYSAGCLVEEFLAPSYPNVRFVPIKNTMDIASSYCEIFDDGQPLY